MEEVEEVVEAEFNNERILLGRKRYVRCSFVDCAIVFDGAPALTQGCDFTRCGIELEGAAVETLRYLAELWDSGASHIVESIGVAIGGKKLRFGG